MEDTWSTICLRSKVGLGYHYNKQSAVSHACACTTICNVYTAYLPHHMIAPCDTCCWEKLYYIAVLLEVTYPKFNWRALWKKGITVFDDPKRSKVNKAFSSSNKFSRLKFNSWNCVLLKFSLVVLLGNRNSLMTFDLLRLSKTVIPFFHWALQLS